MSLKQLKTEFVLSVCEYLHIIFGMAPVSLRVQIAQAEALQLPEMDLRHRATDLPSYKIRTWKNMYTHSLKKKKNVYEAFILPCQAFSLCFVFFSFFNLFLYLSITSTPPPYIMSVQICFNIHSFRPKRTVNVSLSYAQAEQRTNIHTLG